MNEGMLLNNRYQLLEKLGSGGMSDVFRARDLMLERSVAIKVLHENYSNDEAFQERFRQEARAPRPTCHIPILSPSMILASIMVNSLLSWNTCRARI